MKRDGFARVLLLLALAGLLAYAPASAHTQPGGIVFLPRITNMTTHVPQISVGYLHTCALTSEGGVKCWGGNDNSALGNGGTADSLTPGFVSGLTFGMKAVSARTSFTCALTEYGSVKCWGDNSFGQLGDGTTTERSRPADTLGLDTVKAIAAGGFHACALLNSGGVRCWGSNDLGQLGDGTQNDRLAPVNVHNLTSGVAAIAAGINHTCALTTTGGVKCWGDGRDGELGNGSSNIETTPVDVDGLGSGVAAISAGGFHTCALRYSGAVKCWGYNSDGQVGQNVIIGTSVDHPVDVPGAGAGVTAISMGHYYSCALYTSGEARCWGYNYNGQLGDGTTTSRSAPVKVMALPAGVLQIAGGVTHTCALLSDYRIACWGYNASGQLGDGTRTERHTPVLVVGWP